MLKNNKGREYSIKTLQMQAVQAVRSVRTLNIPKLGPWASLGPVRPCRTPEIPSLSRPGLVLRYQHTPVLDSEAPQQPDAFDPSTPGLGEGPDPEVSRHASRVAIPQTEGPLQCVWAEPVPDGRSNERQGSNLESLGPVTKGVGLVSSLGL